MALDRSSSQFCARAAAANSFRTYLRIVATKLPVANDFERENRLTCRPWIILTTRLFLSLVLFHLKIKICFHFKIKKVFYYVTLRILNLGLTLTTGSKRNHKDWTFLIEMYLGISWEISMRVIASYLIPDCTIITTHFHHEDRHSRAI